MLSQCFFLVAVVIAFVMFDARLVRLSVAASWTSAMNNSWRLMTQVKQSRDGTTIF